MNDLLADFYARGGKISKIEDGKRSLGMTDAQWRKLTQMTKEERIARMRPDDDGDSEIAAEKRRENVIAARMTSGYEAAIDAMND